MKKIINEIKRLEEELDWNKTPTKNIIKFLDKDVKELKQGVRIKHKIIDILVEVLQIAIRNKIDIDKEFRKHLKETRKKYLR